MVQTRLRGVLFDAGGTLVQVHVERLAAALRKRGADPTDLDAAFWRTLVLADAEMGMGSQFPSWIDWWFLRLAEHSQLPRELLADAWREADEENHLWDDPIPGASECLTRLREGGLKVGVVSNSDGRVGEALARAGLAELVEVIVDSGAVGVAKPDPEIFSYALGPLNLAPEETWYLGDSVTYDAAGAEAAGLTAWIIDHRGLHTADYPRRVSSLAEFADLALSAAGDGAPRTSSPSPG
jgi:HAD superfamily hydrolase (TIGR01509 family)